ncbi:MAG: hypothetical protein R2827_15390 [Bdellovibrionales bacterium]
MVNNNYSDKVLDLFGMVVAGRNVHGHSHVAQITTALYWSAHPEKTWQEVKQAILDSAAQTNSLQGKVVSEGKLNVQNLMNQF